MIERIFYPPLFSELINFSKRNNAIVNNDAIKNNTKSYVQQNISIVVMNMIFITKRFQDAFLDYINYSKRAKKKVIKLPKICYK